MISVLYIAFSSENLHQRIISYFQIVQHCRWKTADVSQEVDFPLKAEFKISQTLIQSQKRWIKFCRLLVPVPALSDKIQSESP